MNHKKTSLNATTSLKTRKQAMTDVRTDDDQFSYVTHLTYIEKLT